MIDISWTDTPTCGVRGSDVRGRLCRSLSNIEPKQITRCRYDVVLRRRARMSNRHITSKDQTGMVQSVQYQEPMLPVSPQTEDKLAERPQQTLGSDFRVIMWPDSNISQQANYDPEA